jgi:hypothetical protein
VRQFLLSVFHLHKKEVVNAYKAIESGDLTTANAQISAAEQF